MNRRVRRKVVKSRVFEERQTLSDVGDDNNDNDDNMDDIERFEETIIAVSNPPIHHHHRTVDWTSLPHDTTIGIFGLLSYRDRARLACVCQTWRQLGTSHRLWKSIDMRPHALDLSTASYLSKRCSKLSHIRFRGSMAVSAIIKLESKELKQLNGDCSRDLTDAALSMLVAKHGQLERVQLGPDCERITSDAIQAIALCCPKLKSLRLMGVRDVKGDAIEALTRHCSHLTELGFLDSSVVDEKMLSLSTYLQFLSLAGLRNIQWNTAVNPLSNLHCLVALDVSRTEITPSVANCFLAMESLQVLCALNCPLLEEGSSSVFFYPRKKILLSRFTNLKKGLALLSSQALIGSNNEWATQQDLKHNDKNGLEILNWTEWVLSHALLRIADSNIPGLDSFWLKQGTDTLLRLVKSTQEDVQERAAAALATFVVIDDLNATVDPARAEAVMRGGGVSLLLDLAKSRREGVQSEAAKAIANLSVDAEVAKSVVSEGGINILATLARSLNRWVAEEAAGALWKLSVGEEHKGAIAEAGGIKALVELVFKWPNGGDGVLEGAAGALANLAADKCSMEVVAAGGVTLARFCKHERIQEQAARALATLAAHGDSNGNNAAVEREPGALEALIRLTSSQSEGVRQEAAGALSNLSFDDKNRGAIAAVGGVEALVALAQSCSTGSHVLQERAAGALWGLSVSEANGISIGRDGGVAPLITLAYSEAEDVHETTAGALWNLALNSGNASRIVEEGGVRALVHLCSSSGSKMARFMAALALAYIFDGRLNQYKIKYGFINFGTCCGRFRSDSGSWTPSLQWC